MSPRKPGGAASMRREADAKMRAPEFLLMEELNNIQAHESATPPLGPVTLEPGNGGWWIVCPTTGFGYWYKTLRQACRSWRLDVTEYANGTFFATPKADTR